MEKIIKGFIVLKKLQTLQDWGLLHLGKWLMTNKLKLIELQTDKEDLINKIFKKCVQTIMNPKLKKRIFYIREFHPKNKWMTLNDNLNSLSPRILNTLHIYLLKILDLELISREKVLKPFWTPVYKELSENLSLHTKIDYVDLDLKLSNTLSNQVEEKSLSSTIKITKVQNKNYQKTFYPLSTSSIADKWEKENTNQKLMKTIKIKLYLTQIQKFKINKWFGCSRYIYNKALNLINNGYPIDHHKLRDLLITINTRKGIEYNNLMNKLKNETDEKLKIKLKKQINKIPFVKNSNINDWELGTPKDIKDGSLRDLCKAYKTTFSLMRKGIIKFFNIKFRKKKGNQNIVIGKNTIKKKEKTIKISYLEKEIKIRKNKKLNNIKINNDCRITKINNEYFLLIPYEVNCKKNKKINYCGIDPGVRTLLTIYSNTGIVEIKHQEKLIKKINSKIDLLKSLKTKKKFLNKLDKRKMNVINEIHWKSINYLIKNYDLIFMGDIKTHNIVSKNQNKTLNRNFNDLKFFQFKQKLLFKCLLNNKICIFVNECYTSKTCSSCGNIYNIGSSKIYNCNICYKIFDRDINASKNILMKGFLT